MSNALFRVLLIEYWRKSFWTLLFLNYLYKLISFGNNSIFQFFSSELSDSKSLTSNNSKRKENNTFIWSFGDLIASADHVKGNSLQVLAVKDTEVGVFVRRYSLTSVVAKVSMERKCFKKGNIQVAIKIQKQTKDLKNKIFKQYLMPKEQRKGVVSCLAFNCRLDQFLRAQFWGFMVHKMYINKVCCHLNSTNLSVSNSIHHLQ